MKSKDPCTRLFYLSNISNVLPFYGSQIEASSFMFGFNRGTRKLHFEFKQTLYSECVKIQNYPEIVFETLTQEDVD